MIDSRAEVRRVRRPHRLDEVVRVREVRVGVAAAEVRQRLAVHDRPVRRAEPALENLAGVRARHRVHRVEQHAKATAAQERAKGREIEQAFHQRRVILDRVDHVDAHVTELVLPVAVERHVWRVQDAVLRDLACAGCDRGRDVLRSGATVREVVLHAKVAVGAAGVVARGQDDPAVGPPFADDAGCRGRRQDPAAPHEHPAH